MQNPLFRVLKPLSVDSEGEEARTEGAAVWVKHRNDEIKQRLQQDSRITSASVVISRQLGSSVESTSTVARLGSSA